MTKAALLELGIHIDGKILKGSTNRLYHSQTETDFVIGNIKEMTPAQFMDKFYEIAFNCGLKNGEDKKINEIKDVLNIKECSGHYYSGINH